MLCVGVDVGDIVKSRKPLCRQLGLVKFVHSSFAKVSANEVKLLLVKWVLVDELRPLTDLEKEFFIAKTFHLIFNKRSEIATNLTDKSRYHVKCTLVFCQYTCSVD